ncbi:TrbC/VirB2 family protein [Undibacterium sp. TC9W]|uniref:TrbC/VirB2 family protein n=1 Tax=Undibacterium sp. TC9W TaxID=3413053 RepID=UPI003BF07954
MKKQGTVLNFGKRLLQTNSRKMIYMAVLAGLTMCAAAPAYAEGVMVGAVYGIIWMVLGVVGIVALLILIVIWRAFGAIGVGIVLLGGVVFFVKWTKDSRDETEQRDQAYTTTQENMVQQCLSQGEEKFNIALTGKEKISVVVVGKEKIGRLPSELVLDLKKLPEDVSVDPRAPDELPGLDAIDVVVTYAAPLMIGSIPKYQVRTSTVDIVVKRVIDGVQIAHRKDLSLRRGYCLGSQPKYGMIDFLRKALNRPDLFDEGPKQNYSYRMPFHYIPVVATFGDPATGRFAETELSQGDPRKVRYEKQRESITSLTNCTLDDIKYSNSYATCLPGTADENKLDLMKVYSIIKREDSWLSILPGELQTRGLHTFLIEQRDFSGKPMLAWIVNFKVPKAFSDMNTDFTLADASFDQQKMSLNLLWKPNHSFSDNTYKNGREWFEMQSIVHAELPGLR